MGADRLVLPGLDQYSGKSAALSGEDIVVDVVADHQGMLGAGAEVRQCSGEERLGRLADHFGCRPGRLLQAGDERSAVQLQAVAGAPVHAAAHGDQPGASLQVTEGVIECLVAELRPRAADQHDVHRGVVGADESDSGQVWADVAAVEQQAPGAGIAWRGGRRRR